MEPSSVQSSLDLPDGSTAGVDVKEAEPYRFPWQSPLVTESEDAPDSAAAAAYYVEARENNRCSQGVGRWDLIDGVCLQAGKGAEP